MRLSAALMAVVVSIPWMAPVQAQRQEPGTLADFVGYVVEIGAGPWEASGSDGVRRRLPLGSGVRAGDVFLLSQTDKNQGQTLKALMFATGGVVTFKSGNKVTDARPPSPSLSTRLLSAFKRRINNETLAPGFVRGTNQLTDAVLEWPKPASWLPLFSSSDGGDYVIQFRRLDTDGAPRGNWEPPQPVHFVPGAPAPSLATTGLSPGLWQVVMRAASGGGTPSGAWVLFTSSPAAPGAFKEISQSLKASTARDPENRAIATQIARAAMLELAEMENVRR